MRHVARLKMGYYPSSESEGQKIRSLLSFSTPASVTDPCVGQGTALYFVTSEAQVCRYGVELDAELESREFTRREAQSLVQRTRGCFLGLTLAGGGSIKRQMREQLSEVAAGASATGSSTKPRLKFRALWLRSWRNGLGCEQAEGG
jgi:hypothetical protein